MKYKYLLLIDKPLCNLTVIEIVNKYLLLPRLANLALSKSSLWDYLLLGPHIEDMMRL